MRVIPVRFNYVKWAAERHGPHSRQAPGWEALGDSRWGRTCHQPPHEPLTPFSDASLSLKSRCQRGNVIVQVFCIGN